MWLTSLLVCSSLPLARLLPFPSSAVSMRHQFRLPSSSSRLLANHVSHAGCAMRRQWISSMSTHGPLGSSRGKVGVGQASSCLPRVPHVPKTRKGQLADAHWSEIDPLDARGDRAAGRPGRLGAGRYSRYGSGRRRRWTPVAPTWAWARPLAHP